VSQTRIIQTCEKQGFFSISVQIFEQDHTSISGIIYGSTFIPNKAQSASSISVNSERGKCSTGHFFFCNVIQSKLIHNYCHTHCHLNPIARYFLLSNRQQRMMRDFKSMMDCVSVWCRVSV